jgi:formate hydrogenlyase subunit 3/multisubunit Na+/H+ antiporter MnhD subunit
VLSGAVVKAGIIGLIRFLPSGEALPAAGQLLAVAGFVTAFYGVLVGLTQRHPKAVLAYSSVSQMGVVATVLGLGLATGDGAAGIAAAFYAAHHVLVKGALFLAVGVAAACGARARWFVLAPALVLALGFGGLPMTGGWLAKEAVKTELGSGIAGALSALSAVGSTVLMLHFVRRLAAGWAVGAAARPAPGILLPWLGLAAAALLVPVLCFVAVGGSFGASLRWSALAKALWPVLAGALLFGGLLRWGGRLPGVPEGDVILLARRALSLARPVGTALSRAEAALRAWPAAGLALLAVALTLGAMMLSSGRTG